MLTQFVFKNLANMTMKWTDLMINGVVICLKMPLTLFQKGYVLHYLFICICVVIQYSEKENVI